MQCLECRTGGSTSARLRACSLTSLWLTHAVGSLAFADLNINHADPRIITSYPLHDSFQTGLALKTTKTASLFRFADPFTFDLYLTMLAFVVGCAAFFVFVELIWPSTAKVGKSFLCDGHHDVSDWTNTTLKTIYNVLSAMMGGEDYEYITWPARIIRVGMLLVVLVVNATYTANLAAFLTAPSSQVYGPTSQTSLLASTGCLPLIATFRSVGEYVATVVEPTYEDVGEVTAGEVLAHGANIDLVARWEWVQKKLDTRECDVILNDVTVRCSHDACTLLFACILCTSGPMHCIACAADGRPERRLAGLT